MSADRPVKLSIVTVCRNDLTNLKHTMASLQQQSQKLCWEHVLIDGASDDGTQEWYASAGFNFPHRSISERDGGIYDAMNKSLDVVTGDYVIFMNAGDRFADGDVVGRFVQRLSTNPSWGYSRARIVDVNGRRLRPEMGTIPYSITKLLFAREMICHQAVVMRVDLLRGLGGFDLRMGNAADFHAEVKAALREPPVTWADVDVDFLAGGVSDIEVYRGLWDRHRSRVDALAMSSTKALLDSAWTSLQVEYVRIRKRLKPFFGDLYLKLR